MLATSNEPLFVLISAEAAWLRCKADGYPTLNLWMGEMTN